MTTLRWIIPVIIIVIIAIIIWSTEILENQPIIGIVQPIAHPDVEAITSGILDKLEENGYINGELQKLINGIDPTRGRPFPYGPHHASHIFKKYARKAGLKEDLHLHCLRHTAASDLVRAGVQPMQIQKLLGHSSLEVTQIYVHFLPEDLREAVENLTCG